MNINMSMRIYGFYAMKLFLNTGKCIFGYIFNNFVEKYII